MSERINQLSIDQPQFTPYTAVDAKKASVPYGQDTIAISLPQNSGVVISHLPRLEKPAAANPQRAIEEALRELQHAPAYTINNSEKEDEISKKPRGSDKPQRELAALHQFQGEVEKKKKVVEPAEQSRTSHGQLEKFMLEYYRIQQDLEGDFAKIFTRELELQEGQQTRLGETYSNLNQDIEAHRKNSELLGWINAASTCAVIAAALAVYFTGGTSALLNFGMSGAGITGGISTASKAVIDYNADLKKGELTRIDSERREQDRLISDKAETLANTAQQLLDIATMMREILEKQSEVTRIILG